VELFLNIAGAFAAVALICVWLWCERSTRGNRASRKTQLVALALLILIIFPVISVTDDLLAVANPAETDVLSRRDLKLPGWLDAIPAVLPPGEGVLAQSAATHSRQIAWLEFQVSVPAGPTLAPVENRPPPAL
jgi:hypothetical protein